MAHRARLASFVSTTLTATAALTLAACGDDGGGGGGGGGGNDVDPRVIAGGGVGDGAIDGEVNVHVIDADTDAPIAGARVYLGEAEHQTDAAGLTVITEVAGPQTITVVADGYVTNTWVGVDGANVTVPLDRPTTPTPTDVPQGTVEGTITGWNGLDAPLGRYVVAFAGYSLSHVDDDPANELEQPTPGGSQTPQNVCVDLSGVSPCNWTVTTRAGQLAIYAFLGTIDAQQDVEVTGFAYADGIMVDDGEEVSGVALAIAGAGDLARPTVTIASAPAGTDTVTAAIVTDLGADGRLFLPLGGDLDLPIPRTSLFPGSSQDLLAIAETAAAGDDAQSIIWQRGLASLDGLATGSFLPLPTGVQTDGTTFTFTAVAGGTLHVGRVSDTDGDDAGRWSFAIFDGSTSIAIPPQVTLPAGALDFAVQAMDVPGVDLTDFSIDEVEDTIERISSASVEFSN